MKKWSLEIPEAQFLCVCVESARVAVAFHHMFDFGESVVNGFIPSRPYMPVGYGQLGCSGFVISDVKGNFVTKKSKAFLQVGEAAFENVESILSGLFSNQTKKKPKRVAPSSATTTTTTTTSTNADEVLFRAPPSVGVDSMDEEHQICTDAFLRTMKDPCLDNLQELLSILEAHFQHEEDLLSKYTETADATTTSSFSSLNSHKMDHQRILAIGKTEVSRIITQASSSSSCSMDHGGRE